MPSCDKFDEKADCDRQGRYKKPREHGVPLPAVRARSEHMRPQRTAAVSGCQQDRHKRPAMQFFGRRECLERVHRDGRQQPEPERRSQSAPQPTAHCWVPLPRLDEASSAFSTAFE